MPQPSILEKRTTQNSEVAFKLIDEKSKSSLPFTGKKDSATESRFVQQSDTSFHLLPTLTPQVHGQSLKSTSDSTQGSDFFKTGLAKSTTWDQKNTQILSETPLFDSKIPVAPTSAFSSGPRVSEKGLFTKVSEKPSRPNDGLSAATPLRSAFSSSSLSSNNESNNLPKPSTSSPVIPSSSGASVVLKQEVSQRLTSVPSTLIFPSTLPSSTRESSLTSISPSSSITNSEPVKSFPHPPAVLFGPKSDGVSVTQASVANVSSKTDEDTNIHTAALQPALASPISDSRFGTSIPSGISESSTNSISVSGFDFGGSSTSSSVVTSAIKTEQPTATEALSPVAPLGEGSISSVKNVISDSSHEEEMEEEAPETDQTTGFALGNLAGFGIGSTQNSATPKSNPFGVASLNKDTAFPTSQYMMSASSGELFRPASFNFQPPQPSGSLQQTAAVNFSGGFGSGASGQVSAAGGFGQPSNIGAGQQVLGSVLGTFGQSRQLGAGLPGSNVASPTGFGGGFMGASAGGFGGGFTAAAAPGGGFASLAAGGGGFAAAGGGFAAAATAGGGFAAAASASGGFAAAATGGGGFAAAGGGFASSATPGATSGKFLHE